MTKEPLEHMNWKLFEKNCIRCRATIPPTRLAKACIWAMVHVAGLRELEVMQLLKQQGYYNHH